MIALMLFLSQVSYAAPEGLTRFHALAEKNSELIEMAKSREEQAEERKSRAAGAMHPQLNGRYSYTEIDPPPGASSAFTRINQYSALINLTQPVYRASAYAGYSFTKIDIELQRRLREQEGLGLWLETGTAYYNLWMAKKDLENLNELEKFSLERVKELKERVNVGRSRRGELSQVEAQHAQSRANVITAQRVLAQAQERVTFLAGSPQELMFYPLSDKVTELPPVETYLAKIDERPDVKARASQIMLNEELVDVAKAGHHPTVDFTANYYGLRTGVLENSKWDIGVAVVLPLYLGGQVNAQTKEAVEKKREAILAHARLRREADRDIRTLWEAVAALGGVVKDLKEAFEKAKATYEANKKDYRYGLVTNLDVLLSLNQYIDTKRTFERASVEKELSLLQLALATGEKP